MDPGNNPIDSDQWAGDLETEPRLKSFSAEDMFKCAKCGRNNPPTCMVCMYCGVKMELSADQSKSLKPVLRRLDPHENGVNLIYLANLEKWDDRQIAEVSQMTGFNRLKELVLTKTPLPLARTSIGKEIEIVLRRLNEIGIKTCVLADEEIGLKQPVKRIRKIDFLGERLAFTDFNSGEVFEAPSKSVMLIVVGALFKQRVEATERYNKKSENEILDASQTSADKMIFDIYLKDLPEAFRVSTEGFDFSCLGNEKGMLASQNINVLIAKLKRTAVSMQLDDKYLEIRGLLTNVWEPGERIDSKGIKRKGLASFNRKSIITTDNLTQFIKYSRMRWYLYNEDKE